MEGATTTTKTGGAIAKTLTTTAKIIDYAFPCRPRRQIVEGSIWRISAARVLLPPTFSRTQAM